MKYTMIVLGILAIVCVGCRSSAVVVQDESTATAAPISPITTFTTVPTTRPTTTLTLTATRSLQPTTTPTEIVTKTPVPTNQLAEIVTVEFVSQTLSNLDNGIWDDFGPHIAVGDVTGDSQPEIILALQGEDYTKTEGVFWRHPVIFSRHGLTFEKLAVSWLGIAPPAPKLSTADRQGLSISVAILDINQDGLNEVVVGTTPYRNGSEYGAVYIFQWTGTNFMAVYSDYCLGSVYRLDLLGDDQIALSTFDRPIGDQAAYEKVCPEIPKTTDKRNNGLYSLGLVEPNQYETQVLVLDRGWITTLAMNTRAPATSHFVRFDLHSTTPRGDWATAQLVGLDGPIVNKENILPQIKSFAEYMEAADLDGDEIDEIINLTSRDTQFGDVFTWQVFKMIAGSYQLLFESAESEPLKKGIDRFVTGDVDNDGLTEIIDNRGSVYKWNSNQLCYQGNLIEAIEQDLEYGLEGMYIGDVYGNGENKIIFTGRYSHDAPEAKTCLNEYACTPQMYIVSLAATLPANTCQ